MARTQQKIEELESVRGLAALLVVIYHIPPWSSVYHLSLIRNGYLMVQLFFVLSGFVIYNAYAHKIKTRKDLMRFQFLRLGRLYPVHLFFLIIYIFIELAKYYAQLRFGIISPNSQPFRENNGWALLQNLFLIQAIGPTSNIYTFNGPAWSISVEFYTYLLFGIIILYAEKFKIRVFAGLILTSLGLIISHYTYGFENLLSCCTGFFLGCMIGYFEENRKLALPRYASLLAFLSILFFLIFKPSAAYDIGIYFLAAFLILSLTAAKDGILNKILKFPLFVWLGTMSFSIYMSHFCIMWIANQVIRVILKKPEIMVDGKITPQLTNIETLAAVTMALIAVFIVSPLVYKFIETPFRSKSRRIAFSSLA